MQSNELFQAFEALASRRSYDLERQGGGYANHVTNDAFFLFCAGAQGFSPVAEQGPWFSGKEGTNYFVESHDSTVDARLHVSGDFGTEASRLAYTTEIARRLNVGTAMAISPEGEALYPELVAAHRLLNQVCAKLGLPGSALVKPTQLLEKISPAQAQL